LYNLDKKSPRKYFNPKKMEESVQKIADRIINIEDNTIKKENIEAYLKIITEEEEKYGRKRQIND